MKKRNLILCMSVFLLTSSCSIGNTKQGSKKIENLIPKSSCEIAIDQSEKINDKIEPLANLVISPSCTSAGLKKPSCISALTTVCTTRKDLTLIADRLLSQCDGHPKKYLTDMLGAANRKTVRLLDKSC